MAEMKNYAGGCHCGKVRFEVATDLARVIECNCSHCSIKGLLMTFVPQKQFNLMAGAEGATDYQFNRRRIHHLFCRVCGVQSYATGSMPDGTPMVGVNVRCLSGVDLTALKITQFDGKSL